MQVDLNQSPLRWFGGRPPSPIDQVSDTGEVDLVPLWCSAKIH